MDAQPDHTGAPFNGPRPVENGLLFLAMPRAGCPSAEPQHSAGAPPMSALEMAERRAADAQSTIEEGERIMREALKTRGLRLSSAH